MHTYKTIFLLVCLTLINSFECKINEKANLFSSTAKVISSPALIQSKLKETITAKVLTIKLNQDNSTVATATATPAATTPTANTPTATTTATATTDARATTSSANFDVAGPQANPDNIFLAARNIVCNANNCFFPYGVCTENNTVCQCLDGYANFKVANSNINYYCSYQQKRQVIGFLLEFFVSLGVGHFYAGRVLFGVFKLLIMLGPIVLSLLMCCSAVFKNNDTSSCVGLALMIGSCLFVCTGLVWQLVDIIMFGINSYKDGNGVPLQHW